MAIGKLNGKHEAFCNEYLIDFNGSRAVRDAGYQVKFPGDTAQTLLKRADVRAYLHEKQAERTKAYKLTHQTVLDDIALIKQDAMGRIKDGRGNKTMASHMAGLKACELEGKHLGMFVERVDVRATIETMSDADIKRDIAAIASKIGARIVVAGAAPEDDAT